MVIIVTRVPSCKLHEERPFMHSRTKEDACRFTKADPASDIQRRPIREAAWLRNLEQLSSILQESSKRFRESEHDPASADPPSANPSSADPASQHSMRNRPQNQARIAKSRAKIAPGIGLGAPKIDSKSLPGPSRDAPWCPRVSGRLLGSVLVASWGVPGAPRERPEDPQNRLKIEAGAPKVAPVAFFKRFL